MQNTNNGKTYKQIIEQIISLIVKGDLKDGDKLPGERILSESLNASRSSIREAFRTLEILGILEVRHGGGTFVRDFNIAPFINAIAPLFLQNVDIMGDMMDFRIMLESEAIKVAAVNSDPQTLEEMKTALCKMRSDDPQITENADVDFHISIFKASGNRAFMLAGQCLSYILYNSIHSSRTILSNDKVIAKRWLNEHEQIFQSVKNHQIDKAEESLCKHLNGVRTYLLKMHK